MSPGISLMDSHADLGYSTRLPPSWASSANSKTWTSRLERTCLKSLSGVKRLVRFDPPTTSGRMLTNCTDIGKAS